MTADAAAEALVRELHHRVKNNFQIIASLISLKKRMAAPPAQEDIRFIEEHVTSMAVAYRLVYATGPMVEVGASELLPELVSALRVIAGLPEEQIAIEGPTLEGTIGLDHAIALGLFLSVSLPPYLDHALASNGRVTLATETAGGALSISISGDWGHGIAFDVLRRKLMAAYVRQLGGRAEQDGASGRLSLRILSPATGSAGVP